MKIGILTFHCAINYGAVLQAYGLQEYLKKMGHEVYIIDYQPSYLIYPYRVFRWDERPKSLGEFLKWFIRELFVIPTRWRRKLRFKKFVCENLNLCKLDFDDINNDFDAFVFGSDQIWNKQITNGFDCIYWGDFIASRSKRKISYAASFGDITSVDLFDRDFVVDNLSRFYKIGVREKSIHYVLKKLHLDSYYVLDPVLLAGKEVYRELVFPVKEKSYLLLFTLGRDEYVIPYASKIAEELGLDIIEIVSSNESIFKGLKQDLGPSTFLSYLFGASYVVTSSFHGTAFSILFSKNFNVVRHQSSNNERIMSLLSAFHLEHKLIVAPNDSYNLSEINYACISDVLNCVRELSHDFLVKSFEHE